MMRRLLAFSLKLEDFITFTIFGVYYIFLFTFITFSKTHFFF